jgi:hypothetical protein
MSHRLTLFVGLIWLAVLGGGMAWFDHYMAAAGPQIIAPSDLPSKSGLPSVPGRDTLVMVVHPQCPCSRASLAELDRLMSASSSHLTADVVFVQYAGVSNQWSKSDNWRQAAAIPGVHVLLDPNGILARRLGALTSGQSYLYSPTGRLLFQGGLTGGRGEEGDNAGLSAVNALLAGKTPARTHTLVFGCPLFAGQNEQKVREKCPA